MSVHCNECAWLESVCWGDYVRCTHPTNRIQKKTWYQIYHKYKKHPKKLNKDMNCKYYRAKKEETN